MRERIGGSMRKLLLAASAILVASPALAAGTQAPPPLTDAERAQALQDLQDLKSRISAIETRLGVTPPPAAQYTPPAERKPRDHNLEVYGFAQLDAIQDFDRVNPDWDATLRPSRIPTTKGEFGSDGQSLFSIRQSRLGVKANGTIADKPYEAKFEFDLYGTGVDAGQTTMRIRHAYASWGPLLFGQTNTLFMDGDVFPNVLDYWGPAGMVFVRNPQIRFTFLNKNGWKSAVALEHATGDIDPGNIRLIDPDLASNIRNDEKVPDVTAMIRYDGKWGHVQLAGIVRRIGYETIGTDDNEPRGHKTGWGLDLTSSLKASLATFHLSAVYGRGIATYMNDGGMDLAPSVAVIPGGIVPSAEAVKLFGMMAYVDLAWSKQFSSSIGYSFDKVNNTNFQEVTAFQKGQYASANLLYYPNDKMLTGLEVLWGKRTDNDDNSGTDLRVQSSFKWSFSSKNIWDWFE